MRGGPGEIYPILSQLLSGEQAVIIGRNQADDWLYIEFEGGQGWIAGWLVEIEGPWQSVPVILAPPAPPEPEPSTQPRRQLPPSRR